MFDNRSCIIPKIPNSMTPPVRPDAPSFKGGDLRNNCELKKPVISYEEN